MRLISSRNTGRVSWMTPSVKRMYLERKPGPDLLGQNLGHYLVEGGQDLHSQLRLDAALVDQVVKGIRQGQAEASQVPVSPVITLLVLSW
jgi:hypothetical protein